MTIHLPEDLERYVQFKVASGRFPSEDEAVAEAVRLFQLWEGREAQAMPYQRGQAQTTGKPGWKHVL
jgi:putative addiction module CopG family antidote